MYRFAYFFYGPSLKYLRSLSEIHVQYIFPVNKPSLEDDWLRAKVGEREREREMNVIVVV